MGPDRSRSAGPATVQRSPRAALTLPRLRTSVPRQIVLHRSQEAAAEIAAALLRAGILAETDWDGYLDRSLRRGLTRWLEEEMDASELERLPLALVYTDDVQCLGFTGCEGWWGRYAEQSGDPVGGFGLMLDHQQIGGVTVGPRLKALNFLEPELGYHVMALVDRALWRTVGAATPAWALHELDRFIEWMEDEEAQDDPDFPTLDRFHAEIPEAACRTEFDLELIRAGAAGTRDPEHRQILDAALAVAELLPKYRDDSNHLDAFEDYYNLCRPIYPVCVRWSKDDMVVRLFDDYLEMIQQSGEGQETCWIHGFQVCRPETIDSAAAALQRVVEIVVRLDALLELLHCDDPAMWLADRAGPVTAAEQGRCE